MGAGKLSGWHLATLVLGLMALVTWVGLWGQRQALGEARVALDTLTATVKSLDARLATETAARTAIAVSVLKLTDDVRDTIGTMRAMHGVLETMGMDVVVIRRRLETDPARAVPGGRGRPR
jgi:hypothetical protein